MLLGSKNKKIEKAGLGSDNSNDMLEKIKDIESMSDDDKSQSESLNSVSDAQSGDIKIQKKKHVMILGDKEYSIDLSESNCSESMASQSIASSYIKY